MNCNEKFSSNLTHAWLSMKMGAIQSLLFNRIFIQANTKATPFIELLFLFKLLNQNTHNYLPL